MSYFVRHLDNFVGIAGRQYGLEGHTMAKNAVKTGKDPRVRYTRKILRDSLIELMKTRPAAEIGVKEICALAELSRSTFYIYYEGVPQLLEEIEEEAFVFLEDVVNQYGISLKRGGQNSEALFQRILQYIADTSPILQILLSENGDISFPTKVFQQFIPRSQKILRDASKNPVEAYIHEGYSVFVVHGAVGLVQYWLKNNMQIPVPVMAKMLTELTQPTRE
jgi:AcrR family transcriptional regulator